MADTTSVSTAIVAYVGFGHKKFPMAESHSVRSLDPENADALLREVHGALAASDRIVYSEVEPFDDGLRGRVHERLGALLPMLDESAIEALAWRWGFLNLR